MQASSLIDPLCKLRVVLVQRSQCKRRNCYRHHPSKLRSLNRVRERALAVVLPWQLRRAQLHLVSQRVHAWGDSHGSLCINSNATSISQMFSATLHELRRECANIEPPRTPSSMPEVKTSISKRTLLSATCLALLFLCATVSLKAQTEEAFGDAATDPVRLFERGQSAHSRGELEI